MASLRRHPRSPHWQAIINLPDGRKTTPSTGTTKKREVLQIAIKFEEAANMGQQGTLVERRARKTIADIYFIANQATLETSSIKLYLENWLKQKQIENCEATAERYSATLKRFISYLGTKAEQDVTHLNSREIYAARDLILPRNSKAEQVVKVIILAGADVNVKSTLGFTPLIWAARAGNLEITNLLIDKGANDDDTDNDGNNALRYARNPGTTPPQQ